MRQLLFTGFNAFGQHNRSNNSNNVDRISGLVVAFTEIRCPPEISDNDIIIALSWRYTAYASGRQLLLHGLLACAPSECLIVETPVAVKALAACDTHCLVLLENGEIYKLEAKLHARLQRISLETVPATTGVKRTSLGLTKESKNTTKGLITHIACGLYINVAISDDNVVYSIPSCLHQFPQRQWRVQQLTCGYEHALLLNANGDVYSWGNGFRGQLGQETVGVEEVPALVEALAGIKITHIAAGGWHSAAISTFGDIYTWGLNCNGQLGMRVFKPEGVLKEPTVYHLPQLHDLPECDCKADDCAAIRIYAGARHTVVVRSCGKLWGCGWTSHGQLGQQRNKVMMDTFQALQDAPCMTKNCDVICGPWATLLVLSK